LLSAGPAPGIQLVEETKYGDFIWRPYSFYGLSGDDAPWANFAYYIGTQKYPTGIVLNAIPGVYNLQSLVSVPQNPAPCSLLGKGRATTIFQCNAAGSGIYAHRNVGYGVQFGAPDQQETGSLKYFKVDGSNAPVNTIGLDCGDGWGMKIDVACSEFNATQTYTSTNGTFTPGTAVPPLGFPIMFATSPAPPGFTIGVPYYVFSVTTNTFKLSATPGIGPAISTAGSGGGSITGTVPLYHTNRVFFSEKQEIRAQLRHNSFAALFDTQVPTHDHSQEYNEIHLTIFCDSNQDGVIISAGVNLGGSDLNIVGNMAFTSSMIAGQPTNNVAALKFVGDDSLTDQSRMFSGRIRMKVEGNAGNGSGSVYPFAIWSDGEGYIRASGMNICHSITPNNLVAAGAEFTARGILQDNSAMITVPTPAVPGTGGGTVLNQFPYDIALYSTGGTGVSYTLGNTAVPTTSGFITVIPSGGTITVAYTTTPAWTWVPIGVVLAT
jgi:hypothetical protein